MSESSGASDKDKDAAGEQQQAGASNPPAQFVRAAVTGTACTDFDDPLRQKLSPLRFEKAVLLAVNSDLRRGE